VFAVVRLRNTVFSLQSNTTHLAAARSRHWCCCQVDSPVDCCCFFVLLLGWWQQCDNLHRIGWYSELLWQRSSSCLIGMFYFKNNQPIKVYATTKWMPSSWNKCWLLLLYCSIPRFDAQVKNSNCSGRQQQVSLWQVLIFVVGSMQWCHCSSWVSESPITASITP